MQKISLLLMLIVATQSLSWTRYRKGNNRSLKHINHKRNRQLLDFPSFGNMHGIVKGGCIGGGNCGTGNGGCHNGNGCGCGKGGCHCCEALECCTKSLKNC